MNVSVVIVSLNGRERIRMPLDSLRTCVPAPAQILLVDNGSTDGLTPLVKSHYPEVEIVRSPRNLGFAGGNNLGIMNASGDMVILLNDDTEPRPDWLAPLLEAFKRNPRLGVAGCSLLYPGGEKIQHRGGVIHANGLTDHVAWGEKWNDDADLPRELPSPYVTGAAMAIRRDVFDEVGLLDAGFWPIYFEEVDFCDRAIRRGWECAVVPRSVVVHHESQTTVRLSPRFLRTYHRNRIRYLLKNRSVWGWLLAIRAEARWMVENHPWQHLWPCALAYAWVPFQLADILCQRLARPHPP